MSEKAEKKSSAGTVVVLIVLVVLATVVAVFALLNREGVQEKRRLQDDAEFLITIGGDTVTVTMAEVEALSPHEVEAIYKKSGKEPETRVYTGVPLSAILDAKGIDALGCSSASFAAADGYASAIPIAEALDPDACYIVIMEEGEPLGKKEDGGSGPFRMILPGDQFSQRWCSFLMEVTLS